MAFKSIGRGVGIARIGFTLSIVTGTVLFAKYLNDKKYFDTVAERLRIAP